MQLGKNFALLWLGQLVSQLGNRLYLMALAWYFVAELHDGSALFVLFVIASLPYLLFGALVGPLVERWNKRKILIGCDVVSGVLVAALVGLMSTGVGGVWAIYAVCFAQGVVALPFTPAVNAMMPDIVPAAALQRAMAYTKMIAFVGQIVGAALGGVLVGLIGVWGAIAVNAASFFVAAVVEAFIKYRPTVRPQREPYGVQLRAGWRYLMEHGQLKWLTLLAALSNLFVPVVILYVPLLVKNELSLGATHYGVADAMIPVGSILVSLYLSRHRVQRRPLHVFALGIAGVALCCAGLAVVRIYPVLLTLLLLYGWSANYVNVAVVTHLVQTVAAEQRGRFFSLVESMSYASFSLAYVLGALMQNSVGTVAALVANAVGLALVGALAYVLSNSVLMNNE